MHIYFQGKNGKSKISSKFLPCSQQTIKNSINPAAGSQWPTEKKMHCVKLYSISIL